MITYRAQPGVALVRPWPGKTRLLNYYFALRRAAVRGRIFALLMLIGILFGILLSPTAAHAQISSIVPAGEVVTIHESTPTSVVGAAHKAPDVPEKPATHHHCTIALEVIAPAIFIAAEIRDGLLRPAINGTLVSHAEGTVDQTTSRLNL